MAIELGWPQVIYCAIMLISIGATAANHGKSVKHDIWMRLISAAIALSLLWWGGFFGG